MSLSSLKSYRIVLVLGILVAGLGGMLSQSAEAARPNVLLIITDDQGFGDVASHGNDQIHTPVHDQIASEGARFDRFYVSPVCAPTRAALLTGRYHPRTGVHGVTRGHEVMRENEVTIAEILHANGYATGAFGKWHNGESYPHHPNGQGFDHFIGFCAGHWNNYFNNPLERNGEQYQSEGFIIDTFTDEAISWIEKQASDKNPWFCYVPYNTPHTPWQVPEKFWKKYQGKGLIPTTACAYAMVENIDYNMGRLLDTIERLGQTKDTIVIFMTDNGANTERYNAGMRGRKGSKHEGGTRVPLFIRYPAVIEPGQVVKPITAHIDLLPTLVELTGVDPLPTLPLDGTSLVPLITEENSDWPSRTLFTAWRDQGAVRTETHRLVQDKKKQWMLFDMINDPGETKDLAKVEPELLEKLKRQYEGWWSDVSSEGFDPVPTQIGHSQRPKVELSSHYSYLQPAQGEGISYLGPNGWANDYVTNWTSADSYPSWPVKVVHPGRYRISIDYVADLDAIPSTLQAEIADQSAAGEITIHHNPPTIPSPDRIPRKEVYEKKWRRIELGEVEISNPGEYSLDLKGIKKAGPKFPDIKTIVVERLDD